MTAKRDVILKPCGHFVICRVCYPEYIKSECITCRNHIDGAVFVNFKKEED